MEVEQNEMETNCDIDGDYHAAVYSVFGTKC